MSDVGKPRASLIGRHGHIFNVCGSKDDFLRVAHSLLVECSQVPQNLKNLQSDYNIAFRKEDGVNCPHDPHLRLQVCLDILPATYHNSGVLNILTTETKKAQNPPPPVSLPTHQVTLICTLFVSPHSVSRDVFISNFSYRYKLLEQGTGGE